MTTNHHTFIQPTNDARHRRDRRRRYLSTVSCSTSSQQPTLTQVGPPLIWNHTSPTRGKRCTPGHLHSRRPAAAAPAQPATTTTTAATPPVNVGRNHFIVATAPEPGWSAPCTTTLHQYCLSNAWIDNEHDASFPVGLANPDGYRFHIAGNPTGLTISGSAPCAARTPS